MRDNEILERCNGLEIAVVGLAGRFPGAHDAAAFWRNLRDGVESVSFFTDEEMIEAGVSPSTLADPTFVKARGVLAGAEFFDAAFFGYGPREAELMDPQQRHFLECAWEAMEDAGYDSESCPNHVGVYAGVSMNSYFLNLYTNPALVNDAGHYQLFVGNDKDFLATRVSYKLNLTGPGVVVQTACSTSLVAVHLACRALLGGECDMALAGGASVVLPQKAGYLYQQDGILSPDGHCRAFDERAEGTVSGNGVGIVVLKRLEDALRDGDHVRAVIKGSAINNDGSQKIGYTAPSIDGQAAAIRAAQMMAEVEAETISYVEAHGTGTKLGDPIEVAALTEVFRSQSGRKHFCALGSVKTNVGHLDVAAGVTGLIKAVLAMENGELPPSLHYERPNPRIEFGDSPFYVNANLKEWERGESGVRRAGVSSFGIGGTNAHVVIEEAPEREPSGASREWQLLTLSGRTKSALEAAASNLARHLSEHPNVNLADAAFTLKLGRRRFEHRSFVVGRDSQELIEALEGGRALSAAHEAKNPQVVFMFPGGGAQHLGMARGLYDSEPSFRSDLDSCRDLLLSLSGQDLCRVIYPEPGREAEAEAALSRPSLALPALFSVEYALARLWMSWGVRASAMIGHSLGEYAAACLSGVLSVGDALRLVWERGRLFERLPAGAMLSVGVSEEEGRGLLREGLWLAAVNGPSSCVLSGEAEAVARLGEELSARGVESRRVHIDVAAHSGMLDGVLGEFAAVVGGMKLSAPVSPLMSNLTGGWMGDEAGEAGYWVRHLRETVRFADGVRELLKDPNTIFLEVGPGQALSSLVEMQAGESARARVFNSMRHPRDTQDDAAYLLQALGKLWLAGVDVDWKGFYAGEQRRRLPLPTYPFERRRFWVEPGGQAAGLSVTRTADREADLADWFYLPSWKRTLTPTASFEKGTRGQEPDCLIFADELGLAAEVAERLRERGARVFTVKAGESFGANGEHAFTLNPARRQDYDALFEALRASGVEPQRVLHFWSLTGEEEIVAEESAQARGYYSLLYLAQSLDAAGLASHERAEGRIGIEVVSNALHAVNGGERVSAEKATLLGPCKVIPQEYRNLSCRSIDVLAGAATGSSASRLADLLLAEFGHETVERAVAYRGGQRWAQSFEKVRLPEGEGRLREGGVYLITGGLGGVGLLLAGHLAKTLRARVVLVGRTAFPARERWDEASRQGGADDELARKIRLLLEMEEAGGEVLIARADVADENALRRAVELAREKFGVIHGVFHAAGVTEGKSFLSPLSELGAAETAEQFRPKVDGLRALAKVFEGAAPDFFMLFSSNAAVLGGLGFTAYAAANLYMDAYATSRGREGGAAWVSANWDGWKVNGDATAGVTQSGMERYAMTPAESLGALGRILSAGVEGQVIVSAGELGPRLEVWVGGHEPEDEGAGKEPAALHPRPNLKTPFVEPANGVEETVADIWRRLMGIEKVGAHDNFFELGGHSLLATRILTRLREEFDVKLPMRAFFESPTVAELSAQIITELAERIDPEVLAGLEQLSQVEVEAMLSEGGA